jgi:hypothetical protein
VSAVIGQDGVDLVQHNRDQRPQEVARHPSCGFLMQLGKGELAGAINGDEQVEPAFFNVHLGNVDVEIADGIGLDLLRGGLVTSGNRLVLWRCRQRCNDERVRCGTVG